MSQGPRFLFKIQIILCVSSTKEDFLHKSWITLGISLFQSCILLSLKEIWYLFRLIKMCISWVLKIVKITNMENSTIRKWQTSYSYGCVQKVESSLGSWKVISLGKGFYEFVFPSLEDMRRVLTVGSWNLNPRSWESLLRQKTLCHW